MTTMIMIMRKSMANECATHGENQFLFVLRMIILMLMVKMLNKRMEINNHDNNHIYDDDDDNDHEKMNVRPMGRIRSCWFPHLDFGQRILILRMVMMMVTLMMMRRRKRRMEMMRFMNRYANHDAAIVVTFPQLDFGQSIPILRMMVVLVMMTMVVMMMMMTMMMLMLPHMQ